MIASIIALSILVSCTVGKQLAQKKVDANNYFLTQDYVNASSAYEEIINVYVVNNNTEECGEYSNAGISAFFMGNTKLAIANLKNATHTQYANDDTYYYLAKSYNEIDNLSLEIMTLTDYIKEFPEGKNISEIKERLLYTYVESDNYDGAIKLWDEVLESSNDKEALYESFFKLEDGLNNIDECNSIAKKLLSLNENNIVGLTWFGKKYYRKAEDLYQKEMKVYNKKKTNKQYRILLKALDVVTVDFKKSLKYFTNIYNLQPTPENANYLSHIYGRLSDKKKSEYYKKLAK